MKIWIFVIGFFLGSIFGFSGVVSLVELIEKETEKVAVSSYGPEIPQCDKPLWERITDGCDDSTQDSNGDSVSEETVGQAVHERVHD